MQFYMPCSNLKSQRVICRLKGSFLDILRLIVDEFLKNKYVLNDLLSHVRNFPRIISQYCTRALKLRVVLLHGCVLKNLANVLRATAPPCSKALVIPLELSKVGRQNDSWIPCSKAPAPSAVKRLHTPRTRPGYVKKKARSISQHLIGKEGPVNLPTLNRQRMPGQFRNT